MIPDISSQQTLYADFNQLTQLKKGAREESPEAIRQVAKQFESLFVQMMLKSMRDTVPESELFGSQAERLYRDMYDKQLSLTISNGKGIGLAKVLERQLGGKSEITEPSKHSLHNQSPMVTLDAIRREFSTHQPARYNESGDNKQVNLGRLTASAFKLSYAMQQGVHREQNLQETEQDTWSSPEAFVEDIWPHALEASKQLGVDAEVLVAQSALETGWGKYLPQQPDGSTSYNLFGIKADQRWQGETVEIDTREFRHGIMQQERASFRAYDSVAHAFEDYVQFIMNSPRYQKALQQGYDSAAYASELQQAGYATDPDYANKIMRIQSGETLNSALENQSSSQHAELDQALKNS